MTHDRRPTHDPRLTTDDLVDHPQPAAHDQTTSTTTTPHDHDHSDAHDL